MFTNQTNGKCEKKDNFIFCKEQFHLLHVINGDSLEATNLEWPRFNTVFEQSFADDRSILWLLCILSGKLRTALRVLVYCVSAFQALHDHLQVD